MTIGQAELPFTFLDSTRVTTNGAVVPRFASCRCNTKPPANVAAASIEILLRFRGGDPARAWNLAMTFIVVEEFHFVIGMRVRDRPIIGRAEAWSIV